MNTHTHTNKVRLEAAQHRSEIINILGWNEAIYDAFVYEQGLRFMEIHAMIIAPLDERLITQRAYWAWWRMHWLRIDREFMEMVPILFAHEYESYYRSQHAAEDLRYYPPSSVLKSALV